MSQLSSVNGDLSQAGGQFLTFNLGSEMYAINIQGVREIIQYGAMTVVPLMPRFVRGVINLRGVVVPVIDLQARFHQGHAQVGKKTCVIIFDCQRDGERVEMGLMVDAVSEVIALEAAQIEPAPAFGGAVRRDFIAGMGKHAGRFVILLEPDRAFDVDEMAALCESSQQALAA